MAAHGLIPDRRGLGGDEEQPVLGVRAAQIGRIEIARHAPESQESNQEQTLIEAAEKASHPMMPFLNVTGPTPE